MRALLLFFVFMMGTSSLSVGYAQSGTYMKAKEWKENLTFSLSTELCKAKGFYNRCWRLPTKSCKRTVPRLIRKCVAKVPNSQLIEVGKQSFEMSKKMGGCLERKLKSTLRKKYKFRKNTQLNCLKP